MKEQNTNHLILIGKKNTLTDFCLYAYNVHNGKYDYSKVNYISSKTKIIIICPEHGDFEQLPDNHINGSGCPECSQILKEKNKFQNDLKQFVTFQRIYIKSFSCNIEPINELFYDILYYLKHDYVEEEFGENSSHIISDICDNIIFNLDSLKNKNYVQKQSDHRIFILDLCEIFKVLWHTKNMQLNDYREKLIFLMKLSIEDKSIQEELTDHIAIIY